MDTRTNIEKVTDCLRDTSEALTVSSIAYQTKLTAGAVRAVLSNSVIPALCTAFRDNRQPRLGYVYWVHKPKDWVGLWPHINHNAQKMGTKLGNMTIEQAEQAAGGE